VGRVFEIPALKGLTTTYKWSPDKKFCRRCHQRCYALNLFNFSDKWSEGKCRRKNMDISCHTTLSLSKQLSS